jgi:hypothetical protein
MQHWHFALRCLALSCVLCFARSFAAQQEQMNVPLIDRSSSGNPLEVTGQVLLQETVDGTQLESSWGERVVAKNISAKPILLLVTSLTLIGRHSRGVLRGPGDGPTYVVSDDRFFNKSLIRPGESLVLRDTKPDKSQVECCISPSERGSDPKAEFRVRFVQFADGSTFGDSAQAKDEFAVRAMIFDGLRALVKSYSEHGESGFLAEMRRQQPWSASLPFADIRKSYDESGLSSAIARAQEILATAESHEEVARNSVKS